MDPRPHVALFVETSIKYGCEILGGITRYLQFRQPWSVFLEQRERLRLRLVGCVAGRGTGSSCAKVRRHLSACCCERGWRLSI